MRQTSWTIGPGSPHTLAGVISPEPEAAGSLRCVVVVSFLNEAKVLPTFLASLEAQTRRPDRLILSNDGSTDASVTQAEDFAARHEWATVLHRPPRDPGADRLVGAPEFAAFLWATEQIDEPWDVVVKMDADLELAPSHFDAVLRAFEQEPRLGMAGTHLYALQPDGTLVLERHPEDHVRGPTRFFRRECFEAIQPIPQILGWDGADEVRARARSWRTRSIHLEDGERSVHLRPTGSHDGRLRAYARWGLCSYSVGTHPVGVLSGAALRVREQPRVLGGLAYAWGWARAALQGAPRMPIDIRAARRREDRLRMRRAARRVFFA